MNATIQKWGNSLAIRIPKVMANQIQVSEGDEMELSVDKNALLMRPVRRRYLLSEMLERVTSDNRHEETDWGKPEGREVN
jgi:antitoxin MazE